MSGSWEPFGRTTAPDAAPAAPPRRRRRSEAPAASLDRRPRRALAVLTCMDSRLDPLRDLGLERGDAMVLRNAGATLSEDMERSLRIAQEGLGVTRSGSSATRTAPRTAPTSTRVRAALRDGVRRVHGALPGFSGADAAVRPGDGPRRSRRVSASSATAPATIAAPPASSSATAGPATARAAS